MKKILPLLVFFPLMVIGQTQTENYIKSTSYKIATTTSITNPLITQANQNVTYFDGLGRPIQQVAHQLSGSGKDIVTPIEYDVFGRQDKDYLPYVPNAAASLDYKSSALTDVGTFYNTTTYENTLNPYSKKEFEASPLNRILKQAAPGNDWAIGSGHEIVLSYKANTATEVKLFQAAALWNLSSGLYDISFLDNGNYGANQLYKTITNDENSGTYCANTTEEFKNKEGQVVLKRTYNSNIKHDTYYIYDQYGNLTYVLPPLVNTSTTITQQILDDLGYQYKYDYHNRLVEKKLPGKQWQFMVYDKLDRPVATGPAYSPFGDGTIGWMITKYDVLSRVVYSGWYTATVTATTRFSLQNDQNNLTTVNYETKTSSETIDNITVYYTNLVAPTSFKLLTVNYYDDYNFPNAPSPVPASVLSDNSQAVYYNNTKKPIGLPTGFWVRVLQTPADTNGESSYILYDKKARPVRSYTQNYFGSTAGYTYTDAKIDFSGKILLSETKHKRLSTDSEIKTAEVFTYSSQDRLLSHTHQINTDTPQLLAENSYDELGQLISKKVGNNSTNPLQKVDYFHNIRGWLIGINDINNLVQGNDPKDLFTFRISYNNLTGINLAPDGEPQPLYNGNISENFWRTASDNVLRGYQFGYDNLNRLTSAQYGKSGLATQSYNEGVMYDKNGNITLLGRNGDSDLQIGYITIDNLRYIYAPDSNKLLKVRDDFYNTSGFNDGNTVGDDYDYDTNGNMTVDRNKGIINGTSPAIIYNHLNLPTKITFGATGTIEYLYDANGKKLEKLFTQGTVPTTTKYQEGFQYTNDVLIYFPTAEGYVSKTGSSYKYVFNYTDHLGNIRLSYQDINNDGTITNNEILEENNYYPFGLKHKGYNDYAPTNFKYKFSGKELQDEQGLNVTAMDYRQYDNATGRFNVIDALSELDQDKSPYSFARNSPTVLNDPTGLCPECEDYYESLGYEPSGGQTFISSGGAEYTFNEIAGQWDRTDLMNTLDEVVITGSGFDGIKGNNDDRAGIDQRDDDDGGEAFNIGNGILGNYFSALDSYASANAGKIYNYGTRSVSAAALTEANTARMLGISRVAQGIGSAIAIGTGAYGLYKEGLSARTTGTYNGQAVIDSSISLAGGIAGSLLLAAEISTAVILAPALATVLTGVAIGATAYGVYTLGRDMYNYNH